MPQTVLRARACFGQSSGSRPTSPASSWCRHAVAIPGSSWQFLLRSAAQHGFHRGLVVQSLAPIAKPIEMPGPLVNVFGNPVLHGFGCGPRGLAASLTRRKRHSVPGIQFAWARVDRRRLSCHSERVCRATVDATRAKSAASWFVLPLVLDFIASAGHRFADAYIRTHAATDAALRIKKHQPAEACRRRGSVRQPDRLGLLADVLADNVKNFEHLSFLGPGRPRTGISRPAQTSTARATVSPAEVSVAPSPRPLGSTGVRGRASRQRRLWHRSTTGHSGLECQSSPQSRSKLPIPALRIIPRAPAVARPLRTVALRALPVRHSILKMDSSAALQEGRSELRAPPEAVPARESRRQSCWCAGYLHLPPSRSAP